MASDENCTSSEKTALTKLRDEDTGQPEEENGTKRTGPWRTVVGILCTQAASLGITVSAVAVTYMRRSVPDLELNAFRSVLPLLLSVAIHAWQKKLPRIPKKGLPLSMGIIAATLFATICYYVAFSFLAPSTAQGVSATFELFFGLILYRVFLSEKIHSVLIICVTISVIGVLLVTQPFQYMQVSSGLSNVTNTSAVSTISKGTIIGYISIAFAALFFVIFSVTIHKLKFLIELDQHTWHILFWQYTIHGVVSLIFSFIVETPIIPRTKSDILMITLHSAGYTVLWPFTLAAHDRLSANVTSVLLKMPIFYMTLSQYTVLANIRPGHRNWQEVLGVVFIFISSAILSAKKSPD